nr:uncharacterized protein LOC109149028 [Ipomoea batatas]
MISSIAAIVGGCCSVHNLEALEADPRSDGSQIGDQTGKDCELNEEDSMRSQSPKSAMKENKVEELRNRGVKVVENLLFDSEAERKEGDQNGKTSKDGKAGRFEEAPIAPGTNTEGRQKNLQQQGVMKPAEERDYYVQEEKKGEAPAAGAKPNYLDNNPIDRIINAEDHGNVGEEKKREEPKAVGKGTAPVCENATLNRNAGMGANRGQGVGEGKGKNVQGGRFRQQGMNVAGGGEGANAGSRNKEQGGDGTKPVNPTYASRVQDIKMQGKEFEGVKIKEQKTEGEGEQRKEENQNGKQKEKQETVWEEKQFEQVNYGGRGRGRFWKFWGGSEKADHDPGDSEADVGRGEESEDEGEADEKEKELEERKKKYMNSVGASPPRDKEGGVVSVGVGGSLEETRDRLKQEAWSWCRRMRWEKVIIESDMEAYTEGVGQNGAVEASLCKPKVNCLAKALADRCDGQNVVYGSVGSLPRGFQQLLSLEGLLFTLRLGQQLGRQHYTEHTCSSRGKVQSSRLCRRNQETMRAQAESRGAAAGLADPKPSEEAGIDPKKDQLNEKASKELMDQNCAKVIRELRLQHAMAMKGYISEGDLITTSRQMKPLRMAEEPVKSKPPRRVAFVPSASTSGVPPMKKAGDGDPSSSKGKEQTMRRSAGASVPSGKENPSRPQPVRGFVPKAQHADGKFVWGMGSGKTVDGGELNSLINTMLGDCLVWCRRRNLIYVTLEADDWRGLEESEWRRFGTGMFIRLNRCSNRVNVVVKCLMRCCPGLNAVIRRMEDLPRGLGRVLALEGIPHFVFEAGAELFIFADSDTVAGADEKLRSDSLVGFLYSFESRTVVLGTGWGAVMCGILKS